jgi:hypothetical protein
MPDFNLISLIYLLTKITASLLTSLSSFTAFNASASFCHDAQRRADFTQPIFYNFGLERYSTTPYRYSATYALSAHIHFTASLHQKFQLNITADRLIISLLRVEA